VLLFYDVISDFYVTSYIFWKKLPTAFPNNEGDGYSNLEIETRQVDQLESVAARYPRVIFVVWNWGDASIPYFVEALRARGLEVIDLAPLFNVYPAHTFDASPLDYHPNEAGHAIAAEAVLEVLFADTQNQ
jgi:hypothetical protein